MQWTDLPSKKKPRADLNLKLEKVSEWTAQMEAFGVDTMGRSAPHNHKSPNYGCGRS